jgi:hypothetical protein
MHPDVGLTLNNIGVFYASLGDVERAAESYRRALAIFEATLDEGHPKLEVCRRNFADLVDDRAAGA